MLDYACDMKSLGIVLDYACDLKSQGIELDYACHLKAIVVLDYAVEYCSDLLHVIELFEELHWR